MYEEVIEVLSAWGLRVVGALAVLVLGMMAAKAIRSGIQKGLRKRSVDETLIPFLANLTYYLSVAFVVIAVLGLFGVQVASLVAILGAAAFAVGLALQGTLANFASGVMLLVFRPFRVGDFVDVGGTAGSVQEISVFVTRLNTPDNVHVIVPNAAVWGQTIRNFATNDTRRNDWVVGVSYSDDLDKTLEVINRVLAADDRVLKDPAPTVAVSEMADSSVNIVVRPWCTKGDYWALRFDLTKALKVELEAAGCSIPFPQRDIHVVSGGI